MWENAYLSIKNPKASRALKRALDPGRKLLASLTQLRFATSAIFGLSTWGPPLDQILDPHLDLPEKRLKLKPGSVRNQRMQGAKDKSLSSVVVGPSFLRN